MSYYWSSWYSYRLKFFHVSVLDLGYQEHEEVMLTFHATVDKAVKKIHE